MADGQAGEGHGRRRRPGRREPERVVYEPATVAGFVPPNNLDAEAAVLSACMLHQVAIDRVQPLLRPEHCYSDANRVTLDAIYALHNAGEPVDIVSVANYLREREQIGLIGGASYLAQISDATPAVAHVEAHASMVVEMWKGRQHIALSQKASVEGYSPGTIPREAIREHIEALEALAAEDRQGGLVPLRSFLRSTLRTDHDVAVKRGNLIRIRTGYDKLDAKIAGLHPGEVMIIGARPGQGKTALLLELAQRVAGQQDQSTDLFTPPTEYGVAVFELEMPRQQLAIRMACSHAGVNLATYRLGTLTPPQWHALEESCAALDPLPIWIDDTPAITLRDLRAKCRRLIAEWSRPGAPADRTRGIPATPARKLGAIFIDYLQLMKGREGAANREQEIAEISRGLKELAKELDVPVIALAQLNREVEKRGTKDKRPQVSDLRDSGGIEQDADTIIFLYRDEYYHPTTDRKGIAELIIAKQRNGPLGKVMLRFTAECTRFDNLSDHEVPEGAEDEET